MPKILKVKFDPVTNAQALEQILKWSKGLEQKHIVTPNPEIVLAAQKNHKFLTILNQSDLSIPDGIGILWAATYLAGKKNLWRFLSTLAATLFHPQSIRKQLPERVTGSDLLKQICSKTDQKVFLLGAAPGIAEKAKEKLSTKYPALQIVDTFAGSPSLEEEKDIRHLINQAKPKILFVAYGAPHQELWIRRNLKHLPTVKVAIGVGGAFDFIAGKRQRAPKIMQKLGLEWLYRIIQEPKRIKRIWNATVKFPLAVYRQSKA